MSLADRFPSEMTHGRAEQEHEATVVCRGLSLRKGDDNFHVVSGIHRRGQLLGVGAGSYWCAEGMIREIPEDESHPSPRVALQLRFLGLARRPLRSQDRCNRRAQDVLSSSQDSVGVVSSRQHPYMSNYTASDHVVSHRTYSFRTT